ncbi:hypothetical protein BJ170DRAFT_119409 [Xylariales sp. AK1849]|nr:hypothetical protein BJ170DRAFT_119409 [Xylariales sp. AK1849]
MPIITPEDANWTVEEDGAICKLKKDNKTWAEISKSINRGKHEVKKRHHRLNEIFKEHGTDPNELGENWAHEMRALGREIPSPEKPSPVKGGDRGKKGNKGKDEEEHPNSPKGKYKQASKKKRKVVVVSTSSSSSACSSESQAGEEERQANKHFIYHQVYGELYPNHKTYEPDDFWSEDDCKILAIIEAKQQELKWKYIQAEFFNATGRMVASELIKHKLGATDN